MTSVIDKLLALLEKGQDSALLRFSLGRLYAQTEQHIEAVNHLRQAVEKDPSYSAAWKQLGLSLSSIGRIDEAQSAFSKGIECAQARGDKQAEKEMKVFLRRLEKAKD